MGLDKQGKKRRARLHKEDPKCRLCRVVTLLPEQVHAIVGGDFGKLTKTLKRHKDLKDRMATFDHMRSRLNPNRGKDSKECTRLLCWRCNFEDGVRELVSLGIDEQRARSSMGHKMSPRLYRQVQRALGRDEALVANVYALGAVARFIERPS